MILIRSCIRGDCWGWWGPLRDFRVLGDRVGCVPGMVFHRVVRAGEGGGQRPVAGGLVRRLWTARVRAGRSSQGSEQVAGAGSTQAGLVTGRRERRSESSYGWWAVWALRCTLGLSAGMKSDRIGTQRAPTVGAQELFSLRKDNDPYSKK